MSLFVLWEQFFEISSDSISDVWQHCQEFLSEWLKMYSNNLDLLYKSAENATINAKLWHSWTNWDDTLNEFSDKADNATQLKELTNTVEFQKKMQLFQISIAQMLDQICDIVSNALLLNFVYQHHFIHDENTDYESYSSSDSQQHLISYLENMSEEIQSEDEVSGFISSWKQTLKQHDKTVKNAILEIEKKCDSKLTADIIQKLTSEKQTNLNAFDIQKDECMIYLMISSNQSQETTVTKKQADICSHLEIARDVADEWELNEKQHLFLFSRASHLDFIQNEETLSMCSESDSDSSMTTAESAKKQMQLFLYTDREGETEKSVCNHSFMKVFKRKQKCSAIIVTATSGTAGFNIHRITIHSVLRLNTCDSRFQFFCAKRKDSLCWQDKKAIMIDECSMLSAQMLVQVDQRLRILCHCNDLSFDDISLVLLTEVSMQFAPISESFLLQNPMKKWRRQ